MTDTPRPWDRRADETPKSYAAFRAYVALGARRSVREAARQHHIKALSAGEILGQENTTVSTWLAWSSKHKWVSRANARDDWIARASDDQSDLGIDASHSRPRVSNDNPFSEAQFRTLKYRPAFPDRFGSLTHARAVSRDLFAWYNDAHHHSGLTYLTPAAVHYDRAATVLAVRHRTRLAAYAAHPERFVQGRPVPKRCLRPCGSTGRRNRPARMPQERRSSPRTTHSMG